MKLDPGTYSTNGLMHDATNKLLIGDASDIGMKPGALAGRLYDDACDVGIALRSTRTGAITRWYLLTDVQIPNGDLVGWMFAPTTDTLRKHPQLDGYQLNLAND